MFDLLAFLRRQREFSAETFGPRQTATGVIAHIRKELAEIESNPSDIVEWIDVVILALDGAWRAGASPEEIIETLEKKWAIVESREWPDWRTMSPDKPIEHVRAVPDTSGLKGAGERLMQYVSNVNLVRTGLTARPLDEWHEDFGDALWWIYPVTEAPYSGSPLSDDWPGYHTHWTLIPRPSFEEPGDKAFFESLDGALKILKGGDAS